jgi:hypothetical protein
VSFGNAYLHNFRWRHTWRVNKVVETVNAHVASDFPEDRVDHEMPRRRRWSVD